MNPVSKNKNKKLIIDIFIRVSGLNSDTEDKLDGGAMGGGGGGGRKR